MPRSAVPWCRRKVPIGRDRSTPLVSPSHSPMTKPPKSRASASLDVADRQMLADIKANVLGTSRGDTRIGRFRVIDRLGEGSMGVVFKAVDEQLQRQVALKLLHAGVVASVGERRARVLREAQALARLAHPNIVQVHEVGEHEGQMFMAMELVEGRSLDQIQREQPPRGWKTLLGLYLAAGRGLAAAHAKGVIHRDFKPHNVLVDEEGRVRVVDFGLARGTVEPDQQLTAEISEAEVGAIERSRGDRLTATGAICGTPAYMAPELFDGQPATAASDQFSFCVSLYEAVYGRRPFSGTRLHDVVFAARQGQLLPPTGDRPAARWLFKALARGLAPRAEDRFADMDALLLELARERGGWWKRGGLLALVAVVGGAAWWTGAQMRTVQQIGLGVGEAAGEAAMEQERRRDCAERVGRLRSRWSDAQVHLGQGVAAGGIDDRAAVLNVGAEHFFERWEYSCWVDVGSAEQSCRDRAEREFDGVLAAAEAVAHEDAFHDLTYEFELCLEAEVSAEVSACGRAEAGTPAEVALQAALTAELDGKLDTAMNEAERAVQSAGERGERLTQLRAMLQQGALLEARGEIEDARRVLNEALILAFLCRVDVLAIDVALEQAESEVLHSGDIGRAELALEVAGELLDGSPSEFPLRRARLYEKAGGAKLYLERRCAEGVDSLKKALELRDDAIRERHEQERPAALYERLAADAQLNIANAEFYALAGSWSDRCVLPDVSEAQMFERYREARRQFVEAVGSQKHLGLAEYDFSLGVAHVRFGQPESAIEPFESVLSIYVGHHGPNSLPAGDVHRALAETYRQAKNIEKALEHARENVEIRRRQRGEEGSRLPLVEAYDAVGVILQEAGEPKEARDALLVAIGELDGDLTLKEQEQLRLSYANLALVEWGLGDRSAAKRAVDRAREIQQELLEQSGESPVELPQVLLVEARMMSAKGDSRRALQILERAEELADGNPVLQVIIEAERGRISMKE